MTEEERQKLVEALRSNAFYRGPEYSVCDRAADEIERLAAEVKRLDNLLDAYVERER
jgi:hypothetical protein